MMRNRTHSPKQQRQSGYGLVVIAALFTAFAVVAAAAIERSNALVEIDRAIAARAQLQRLAYALDRYARYNSNRYPCPASRNVAFSAAATFGAPAAATCNSGGAPAGTTVGGSNNMTITGAVPVRVLAPYGIRPEDAYDPWGGQILFAVHRNLTSSGSGTATETDRPQIRDFITQVDLWPADLVLVSGGRDRVGMRIRNQTDATTGNSCAASPPFNTRYLENCDLNNQFITGPITTGSNFAIGEMYDDIIVVLRR